MPFGLNWAVSSFQQVMDKALRGAQDCAVAYIDDILIFSPSSDAHMTHLCWVLDALRHNKLTVNIKKSKLGQPKVQYLGFCIGYGRIWAIPDNVAALQEILLPPTKKDLQRFLALANYYWPFMFQFSARTGPLTDILRGRGKGNQQLTWTVEARAAFEDIQTALCNNTVLYAPLPNQLFRFYTNASNIRLGAILTQETSRKQPIFFLSHKFSKA